MRILLLNLSPDSASEVTAALAGQGYEIASETGLDVEHIELMAPELLITEATPSDLSCCGIITQIKSREQTKSIRVLMVVQGGALERARALDLGADDVISAPFETLEFAATQFEFVVNRGEDFALLVDLLYHQHHLFYRHRFAECLEGRNDLRIGMVAEVREPHRIDRAS